MSSTKSEINKYANSRNIDLNWISDHQAVENLVEELKKELFEKDMYERKRNSKQLDRIHNQIKVLILDLFLAYMADNKLYLGYSRTKGNYKQDGRYNYQGISYSIFVRRIIDTLIELDYLESKNGFRDDPDKYNREYEFDVPKKRYGRQSRMKATPKLTRKFRDYGLTREMIKRNVNEEIIIKRDEDKNDVIYKRAPKKVKIMRENLRYINDVLENTFIGLYIDDKEFENLRIELRRSENREPINFSNKRLRRIFNNKSWDQGGRFYGGWWQLIPKEYRKFIRIGNGEFGAWPKISCVEYDYNAQHARMLYAEVGINKGDSDPYEIEGFSEYIRKLLKRAFNIIVNTKSERGAAMAVDNSIEKKGWILPSEITDGKDLVERTKANHRPISGLLFDKRGPYLQNKDSIIAEKIMLKMFKRGARVLPVHDSFLVAVNWQDDLKQVMEEAFLEVVGVHCPAIRKETKGEFNRKTDPDKARGKLYTNGKVFMFSGDDLVEVEDTENTDYSIYHKMENAYEKANVVYS